MQNIRMDILINNNNNNNTDIHQVLLNKLNKGDLSPTYINNTTDLFKLKDKINKNSGLEAKLSVLDGVYGSNTGKYIKGLTVFCSPDLLPDRWIDEDGDEIVNFWKLINENGHLRGKVDDELLDRYSTFWNLDVTRDNSYNYMHSNLYAAFDIDFAIAENRLFVKFHCGGDVRGNYTSMYVFDFDSKGDVYNAVYPGQIITE